MSSPSRWRLRSGTVIYNDPRRFGFMDLARRSALADHVYLRGLGEEPTAMPSTPAYLAARFAGKVQPLKAALLDQRTIAGLGNIYVCEALWRSGLSPKRTAGTLVDKRGRPKQALIALTERIRAVIADAIAAAAPRSRITFRRTAVSAISSTASPSMTGKARLAAARLPRYGRPHSTGGTLTFYCPHCQK